MENTTNDVYCSMLLFKQEYNLDFNDFYSISFTAFSFKFQGKYNSDFLKKLENLGFVFIIKNSYVSTEGKYENFDFGITLT